MGVNQGADELSRTGGKDFLTRATKVSRSSSEENIRSRSFHPSNPAMVSAARSQMRHCLPGGTSS